MHSTDFKSQLDVFSNQVVVTPQFEHAHNALCKMLLFGGTPAGGRFMLLTGESRTGKTHAVRLFAYNHPASFIDGSKHEPVVHLELQGKATESGTATQMLAALSDLKPRQGTVEQKHARVVKHIRTLGVKLLIVDEAHHLVERKPGQQNRLYAATESFKYISNVTGCSMVFVGIPAIESIVEVNDQFAQRTTHCIRITEYDLTDPDDLEDYGDIVREMCGMLPIKVDAQLLDDAVMPEWHLATRGRIGNLSELLRASAVYAFYAGQKVIDLDALRIAYRDLGVANITGRDFFKQKKSKKAVKC